MAFDFGLRQIGVAVGNRVTGTESPLAVLAARDGQPSWDQVAKLLEEWRPDLLLVGLPLNMDDSESELSRRARKFANRLQGRFGIPLEMVDERLTSREAKEQAGDLGHGGDYRRQPLDGHAAGLLIRQWLENVSRVSGSPSGD